MFANTTEKNTKTRNISKNYNMPIIHNINIQQLTILDSMASLKFEAQLDSEAMI